MNDYLTVLRVPHPDHQDGRPIAGPRIQASSWAEAEDIAWTMFDLLIVGVYGGEA